MSVHTQRLQRCDRCGAEAKYQVLVGLDGLELLLCKHHADKHAEKLDSGKYPILPMLGV